MIALWNENAIMRYFYITRLFLLYVYILNIETVICILTSKQGNEDAGAMIWFELQNAFESLFKVGRTWSLQIEMNDLSSSSSRSLLTNTFGPNTLVSRPVSLVQLEAENSTGSKLEKILTYFSAVYHILCEMKHRTNYVDHTYIDSRHL